MDEVELERKLTLLRAAWAFFDGVAARVSPEMRKGPRGGGRERDEIIGHVIRVESMDFAKGVGIEVADGNTLIPGSGSRPIARPTSRPCATTTPAR